MDKINFSELQLAGTADTKTVSLANGKSFEVKQYLPAQDKYDLIEITIQQATVGATISSFLLEIYFNLNLIFLYTNINFSEEDREDKFKLFDILEQNNIFDLTISNMVESEYTWLKQELEDEVKTVLTDKRSVHGVIETVLDELPMKADELVNIINSFDKTKFNEALNFASAIGADFSNLIPMNK